MIISEDILQSAVPHFQPIVAVDHGRITGYEVLARAITAKGPTSLGPWFHDPEVPVARRVEVDRAIVRSAWDQFIQDEGAGWLAVNVNPHDFYAHGAPTRMVHPYPLDVLAEIGADPRRIVIEITEAACDPHQPRFLEAIRAFREAGCRIAIDDMGTGASDLGRLAALRPDIIKVDRSLVAGSVGDEAYSAILQALSLIAMKMGSALLLEGVETEAEMELALRVGAEYVQGYWLSPAVPGFIDAEHFARLIRDAMRNFREDRLTFLKRQLDLARVVQAVLRAWFAQPAASAVLEPWSAGADDWAELATALLEALPSVCYRLYVCTEDGRQVSATLERDTAGRVFVNERWREANWSARPYFLHNIAAADYRQQAALSFTYEDRETHRPIKTITYPLGHHAYVLIDIDVGSEFLDVRL